MRIVLIVVGAVVLVAVILFAVGATLPVKHSAVGEAVIPAPRDSVYALIAAVERYPEWRTGIERVEVENAATGVRYVEHGSDEIPYEVVERIAGERMVTRIAGEDLPFGGTWTFELEDAGGGTRLRITEDGEVHSPFFRFVSRFLMGHDAGIRRYLRDVETRLGGTGSSGTAGG